MKDPLFATRPALGALELATVARGIVALDQMVKRAENTVVAARTLSPGRYFILLSGNVAEIEEAMDAGREAAAEDRVDELILRDPHPGLRAALGDQLSTEWQESLAIVETTSLASALTAVDVCLKGAEVQLLELRLGAGLTGKGVFTLTGSLPMIQAVQDLVARAIPVERLIRLELIAQPHPDLPRNLLGAEGARPRGPRSA